MGLLADKVKDVISDWIDNNRLFTALDVSNEVKNELPLVKHSEIREIVRGLFATDMQTRGYGRTPIKVLLEDGSETEALLYHSLADSWDLDAKYDTLRRQQVAVNPIATATTSLAPQPAPVPAVPAPSPKQLWDNLFTPTRLFPKF